MKRPIGFMAFLLISLSVPNAFCICEMSLMPEHQEVRLGETFTVTIAVIEVSNLFGHDIKIGFDPSRFEMIGVEEGSFLGQKQSDNLYRIPPRIDNDNGSATCIVSVRITPGQGVSGSGEIMMLHMREKSGLNEGYNSTIELSAVELADPFGNPIAIGNLNDSSIEVVNTDTDGDGLSDGIEKSSCSALNDSDTDDDGIPDGTEDINQNGILDIGETDPCNIDTDGDGIQDGTEVGITMNESTPDTDLNTFQPDLNPDTKTDPLLPDSDGDGWTDGSEDHNKNGLVDRGESDPNDKESSPEDKGDLNRSGVVDLQDVILGLQTISGITPPMPVFLSADVNSDYRLGLEEVIYILLFLSGK